MRILGLLPNILAMMAIAAIACYCARFLYKGYRRNLFRNSTCYLSCFIITLVISQATVATTPFSLSAGRLLYRLSYSRVFFYQLMSLSADYFAVLYLFRQMQVKIKAVEKSVMLFLNTVFAAAMLCIPSFLVYDRSIVLPVSGYFECVFTYMSSVAPEHVFNCAITGFQIVFYARLILLVSQLAFIILIDSDLGFKIDRSMECSLEIFNAGSVMYLLLSCPNILIPSALRLIIYAAVAVCSVAFLINVTRAVDVGNVREAKA